MSYFALAFGYRVAVFAVMMALPATEHHHDPAAGSGARRVTVLAPEQL